MKKDTADSFQFQQFVVHQDRCAMKVGTDGVLLGAWAQGGKRILDIGTGTGLIALMMAQRFPDAVVDAVELDVEAAAQATENVLSSAFVERIHVYRTAIQQFAQDKRQQVPFPSLYDSIVSNPPYFQYSLKNPDARRTLARHTDSLCFRDLMKVVANLLSEDGQFSVVIPFDAKQALMDEAVIQGLFLVRKYVVKTLSHKPPKRCLLSFCKKRTDFIEEKEVVMMDTPQQRSAWYQNLTENFYLTDSVS